MSTPDRIRRTYADEILKRDRSASFAESERERKILDVAEGLMIRCGRSDITMTALSRAMQMAPMTIRRHFADMDEMLGAILLRYLKRLETALAKVPPDHPEIGPAKRAAYLAFTRTPYRAQSDIHHLLLSEGPSLPADIADTIEIMRKALAACLFGPGAHRTTLALLDSLDLDGPAIEAMLATLETLLCPAPIEAAPPAAREPAVPPIRLLRPPQSHGRIKEPSARGLDTRQSPQPDPSRPPAEARAGPG